MVLANSVTFPGLVMTATTRLNIVFLPSDILRQSLRSTSSRGQLPSKCARRKQDARRFLKTKGLRSDTGDKEMISERTQPSDPRPEWVDLKALTGYACVSERTLREWIHRPENPSPAVRVGTKLLV